jgi:hypothetical protein
MQEEREQYMDSLERQMEEQREQIQRTLDRTTEDSDRRRKALEKLLSALPSFPSRTHRADPKRNTLSRRGKSPAEALRAKVQVAAHIRRLIGGTRRTQRT